MSAMAISMVSRSTLSRVLLLSCVSHTAIQRKERKTAEAVVHRMVKRAVEMEGTVTGEHGVGLIKRDYLAHEMSEATVDAMRKASDLQQYVATRP